MSIVFLELILVCFVAGRSEPSSLDSNKSRTAFVRSENLSKPSKSAYTNCMVSFRAHHNIRYFGDTHYCSGAIISRKVVLTAANCIMDKRRVLITTRRMLIVAGTPRRLTLANTTCMYNVAAMYAHPNFVRDGSSDIGVVLIEGTFPENNQNIEIIPMPNEGPKFGAKCTVIGWGRVYTDGPLSDEAMQGDVKLYTQTECLAMFPKYAKIIEEGAMCASSGKPLGRDTCRGDTGGPLICDGILTGVAAWEVGCGDPSKISLYTDVYTHRKWIEHAINGVPIRRKFNLAQITMGIALGTLSTVIIV